MYEIHPSKWRILRLLVPTKNVKKGLTREFFSTGEKSDKMLISKLLPWWLELATLEVILLRYLNRFQGFSLTHQMIGSFIAFPFISLEVPGLTDWTKKSDLCEVGYDPFFLSSLLVGKVRSGGGSAFVVSLFCCLALSLCSCNLNISWCFANKNCLVFYQFIY